MDGGWSTVFSSKSPTLQKHIESLFLISSIYELVGERAVTCLEFFHVRSSSSRKKGKKHLIRVALAICNDIDRGERERSYVEDRYTYIDWVDLFLIGGFAATSRGGKAAGWKNFA